jgi:hypothetical protein
MKSNRIALIAGVVVIAAIVGFLAMRNYWPPKNGTEGAIGAANRYTAQQISDQDVMLKDPKVQAFLQSDTFHQISTNPEFRAFVEELVTRGSAARAGVAENLSQTADAMQGLKLPDNAIAALKDDSFAKLPAAQAEALLSKGGLTLLGDAGFAQALDNKKFQVAAAKGVPEALEAMRAMRGGDKLASSLEALLTRQPDLLAVFADQGFGKWARSDNSQALVDALNLPALNSDNLATALGNMDTRRIIISNNAFQKLGDSKVFISALKDEGFQKIMASDLDLAKTLLPKE